MVQNNTANNAYGLKSVLIARFSAIGDVAMTVPVIYSACRCYPAVHFTMVTRPAMTAIFVNPPENLSVVGVDLKEQYRGIGGMRRLVSDMVREHHIDCFVDLHDVLRTRLMGIFCRLRRIRVARINKGRGSKRALTRRNNKVMLPLISQRARYREAFFHAGLPLTGHFEGLYGGRNAADPAIFAGITAPKPEGEQWIGIAPFAAHNGKVYPPEMMYDVVARLAERPSTRIFLLGGGGNEQQILEAWAAKIPQATCLAGKRNGFAVELALFNHLDVMLTMDSANMHLASIASTPTVSVWGATHSYCGFKGWRQSDDDMVQVPMTCRPCSVFGNKPCHRGDYLCLTAIKPEAIVDKVEQKLQHKSL